MTAFPEFAFGSLLVILLVEAHGVSANGALVSAVSAHDGTCGENVKWS